MLNRRGNLSPMDRIENNKLPHSGFSSTQYILQGGVWWYANCGFSFRSSVSFGQERSSKSAPTTCTNRYAKF